MTKTARGRIAPGYLADLVIIDRDPFAGTLAELRDRKVTMTIVGGRVVYER